MGCIVVVEGFGGLGLGIGNIAYISIVTRIRNRVNRAVSNGND